MTKNNKPPMYGPISELLRLSLDALSERQRQALAQQRTAPLLEGISHAQVGALPTTDSDSALSKGVLLGWGTPARAWQHSRASIGLHSGRSVVYKGMP